MRRREARPPAGPAEHGEVPGRRLAGFLLRKQRTEPHGSRSPAPPSLATDREGPDGLPKEPASPGRFSPPRFTLALFEQFFMSADNRSRRHGSPAISFNQAIHI